MYHDAISKNLDASVAKIGCSELEVAKVATEDLGGHGSDIVEQVNHHCRGGEPEKYAELKPCS